MKRISIVIILLLNFILHVVAYDRNASHQYMAKYANNLKNAIKYDGYFIDHTEDGGDCANFSSQMLIAGNVTFNYDLLKSIRK